MCSLSCSESKPKLFEAYGDSTWSRTSYIVEDVAAVRDLDLLNISSRNAELSLKDFPVIFEFSPGVKHAFAKIFCLSMVDAPSRCGSKDLHRLINLGLQVGFAVSIL